MEIHVGTTVFDVSVTKLPRVCELSSCVRITVEGQSCVYLTFWTREGKGKEKKKRKSSNPYVRQKPIHLFNVSPFQTW